MLALEGIRRASMCWTDRLRLYWLYYIFSCPLPSTSLVSSPVLPQWKETQKIWPTKKGLDGLALGCIFLENLSYENKCQIGKQEK